MHLNVKIFYLQKLLCLIFVVPQKCIDVIHWCGTLRLYACLSFFCFLPVSESDSFGLPPGFSACRCQVCLFSCVLPCRMCNCVESPPPPPPPPLKNSSELEIAYMCSYCPLQIHCSTYWPGQLAFIHISVTDLGFAVSCFQQNWRKEEYVICMLPTERSAYTASTNSWARHIILFLKSHHHSSHFIDIQRTFAIYFLEAQQHSEVNSTHSSKNRMLGKNLGHVLAVNCCV